MTEENYTCNCDKEHNNEKNKNNLMKYLGIAGATLLGSFLAFYFIADMTIKQLTNPVYQFRRMDKMMERQARDMEKFDRKMMRDMGYKHGNKSVISVEKLDDEYKIIVDLKPFDNNEKYVKFELNNNIATVSASIEKEKRHRDSIIEFSQTFYIDGNIDKKDIKKEKNHNQYIITIPLKDND